MTDTASIQTCFDAKWAATDLEKAIASCSEAEIYPLFEKYLKKEMKILESGCGAGKWVFHYHRRGYDITGLDWSAETVARIKAYDSSVKAVQGDARATDFASESFDTILSLGTVEHSIEGPGAALDDAYRILKGDGILILLVPILTPLRRIIYGLKEPLRHVRSWILQLRGKIRGQPFLGLRAIKKESLSGLFLLAGKNSEGHYFFEYRFPLRKIVEYLEQAGFRVLEAYPAFRPDAIYHDLRPLTGTWDVGGEGLKLNWLGRILKRLVPNLFAHMAVCVAWKPA